MTDKQASSEAAWALLTEGVTSARLEVHRLRHLVKRGLKLVDVSHEREHIHQVAGDLLQAIPKRIHQLEVVLDRTSLALSKMGEDYLTARLPLDEKQLVEDAVEPAGGFKKSRIQRVAHEWMRRSGIGWHHDVPHANSQWVSMLEQWAKREGVEANNPKDALEMVAWDQGYSNQKLPPWLVQLGKQLGVDAKREYADGRRSR
jgi:hypothetical protein